MIMGVTDNANNPYDFGYMHEQLDHIEDYSDQDCDNKKLDNMVAQNSPGKTRKVKKSPFYRSLLDRSIRTKKKGVRQARRAENTQYLLCPTEQDEMELPDMEYVDLMEHGLTPFAELFVQQEKMQIWNDFINKSEDDQREALEQVRGDLDLDEGHCVERQISDESWEELQDSRTVHPAYSAEECFKQIDHHLRYLLTRRHLALGILIDLEQDLIPFFTEWQNSVYIRRLDNSFERMLLHALCQFLQLHSSSYDDECGRRQTQVENLASEFTLPSMTLSDYIQCQDGRH